MSKATQLAFNGGEFTEFMDSRVDVAKYGKGCRTLENMNVLPYGAATARTGTKFGGEVYNSSQPTRLIPFVFSDTTTFHIEMSKNFFRFWKDGELVESSPGVPYVLNISSDPIVNNEEEIFDVQFEQINDVVYLIPVGRKFRKLTRFANDEWSLVTLSFGSSPPLGGFEQIGAGWLHVTGDTDVYGSTVTIASNNFYDFTTDHVGSFIEMSEDNDPEGFINATSGNTVEFYAFGSWNITTEGTGSFEFSVETSDGTGLWEGFGDYKVVGTQRNRSISSTTSKPTFVRVVVSSGATGSSRITYSSDNGRRTALYEITSYLADSTVQARVWFPTLPGQKGQPVIDRVRMSYFSNFKGWATSVCLYKNRLCLSREDIYLSSSGDYQNFTVNSLSDGAFIIPLRKSGSPTVRWMQNLRELRVGMTSDECVVTQENVAEGFSYKNYYARFDSSYGSLPMKPEIVNGSLLFVTNDAEVLRNQVITGIENYYDANTLTTLADHILQSGVVQTGLQRQPYPTYYAVREDGVLAVLLYEEAQSIMAWSRHVTDGKYKSVSVVPRPRGEDEVAFIVERVIDGVTKQYVEFRVPDMSKTLRDELYSDMWYVDSGIEVTGTAMATVTGLDHLEGKEVAVLADGIKQTNKTVVAGEITLDAASDKVIVGLPYSYTLEPMMLNSAEVMGQSKQIAAAIVYLWRSGEGLVSVNGGLESRLKTDTDFTGAGLHDGSSGKINVDADWSRETSLTLRGESPLPLNVQSITLEFAIGRK